MEHQTITNLAYSPGAGVRMVVVGSGPYTYLMTLRSDLTPIDFVAFETIEPPAFWMQKKGRCTAHSQGMDAQFTSTGLLIQNDWNEVHDCRTNKLYYKHSNKTTYQLQPDGTFRRLPKPKPAPKSVPAAR